MRFTLFVMVLGQSAWVSAGEFPAKVIKVQDGDTIHAKKENGDVVKIRFELCDAPEIGQLHSDKARDFVKDLCLGRTVTVKENGTDQHGRVLGQILIDGKNINKELIKEGHAWWFYHYNDDAKRGILEANAKSSKKGLWKSETPIYPRNWRRGARVTEESNAGNTSSVFIMALMPNPNGRDQDNETIILANKSNTQARIDEWKLEDDDEGVLKLSGTIPAGETRTIRLNSSLQLGNSGDTVYLKNSSGQIVQTVSYENAQSGQFVIATP